jgi:cytochrome P450
MLTVRAAWSRRRGGAVSWQEVIMPNDPPGPKDGWFGLAVARRFRREPLTFLPELARTFGDLVGFRMGPFRTYFAFHPDLIHQILASQAKCFRRWAWQTSVLRQWDGNGLVISEGDFWRRQRRLVQPAFQPRRFAAYGTAMVAATRRLLDRWETEPGKAVEIVQTMTALTLEIIAKVLFDVDVSQEVRSLGEAVAILSDTAMHEMSSPLRLPDWLPLPRKRRKRWAMRYLDQTIRRIIRERRASGQDKGDLLSMLLLATDEEVPLPETTPQRGGAGWGARMSDEQARDEAMVLFLAGHDTTAAALAWVGYLLARHPDVQQRLADEVRSVLGDREPTADDVALLPYTEAVIKETLRVYPPAWIWFAREAIQDVELGGYAVPRGGIVYVTPWVTHRDPRWFPQPERFDPDRFRPGRPREGEAPAEPLPPCAYFPFGAGPRHCVGTTFAMTEMVLVIACLCQRFHLSLAPNQGEPGLSPLLALRPRGQVWLTAVPRADCPREPCSLTSVR